ncbi:GGDEF domain-containing protein [Amycolatopsis sp. K13G38]|uniref:GGDEF domain-containing protein n=1 Tax=Amycolatopsis acididurans TaxID=2724524 RepID=A0ABX1J5H3_9PSEU|nr:GGDEF domain-containing protein [Amycolatopsis acididurans]NKQ53551.1 GGDEF domain-containing protein [Amycolatopsis acididurans]
MSTLFVLTAVAAIAAVPGWALSTVRAVQLRRRLLTDPLTGLSNRDALARVFNRAGGEVGLLLLDVDRFKQINDTYGHRIGDMLLMALADRLRRVTREGEVAIRLHGDEFAVWLGKTTAAHAARRAEDIANAIARPLVISGQDSVVTASVGHATGTTTLTVLLHEADQAMYAVKRSRAAVTRVPVAPRLRLRDKGVRHEQSA